MTSCIARRGGELRHVAGTSRFQVQQGLFVSQPIAMKRGNGYG